MIYFQVSVTYENDTAASTREDSAYQSLSPSTRDQDQTYTALAKTELPHWLSPGFYCVFHFLCEKLIIIHFPIFNLAYEAHV